MAKLQISHHERVAGDHHRWHVFLHHRADPVPVELPGAERDALEMPDEEVHNLLPSALQLHAEETCADVPAGEEYRDTTWDAPVRVLQTHFMA